MRCYLAPVPDLLSLPLLHICPCLLYTSVSEGGKVNIRVGNGTQYGRITQLAPGTTLDYVATAQNDWNAVVVNARVGWVSGEYSRVI